jgi:hypothetical protein
VKQLFFSQAVFGGTLHEIRGARSQERMVVVVMMRLVCDD